MKTPKNKLLFILTLLSCFSIGITMAQNITCDNPYPNCFGINGIYFSDANNGWAVGSIGLVAHFDGNDWALDSAQDQTTNTLRKAFFLDANTGWIVGDNGTILKYKNGVYTLQNSTITTALYDLHFIDENHGWATGAQNIILKYDTGTWSVDKSSDVSNTTSSIRGINIINASRGWAVGDGGLLYKYNGTSWSLKTSGTTSNLRDVDFADSTLGYIVGDGGRIYKYNMNDQWAAVPGQSGFVYDLYTVQILASNNVWASGSYGTLINYNGTSWSSGSSQGVWYTGLSMVGAKDGWTFGTDGAIYKSTNGVISRFNTIFKNNDGTPYQSNVNYLYSLSLQPNGNGWMMNYNGDLFEMRNNVWKKYSPSLSTSNSYWTLAVINDTLGFAAGTSGTIYKYNGVSWSKITTNFQSSISSVAFYKVFILDPSHVYFAGTNGTLLSYISGAWQKLTVTGQTTTDFYDVYFTDVNTGWVAGANGVLVKYKNGTYTTQSFPVTNTITKAFFFDETEGWAISGASMYHYASNAWTSVLSDQVLVRDFAFSDRNNGLLIGPPYYSGGAGGVISKYDGNTFTRIPNYNFVQNLYDIEMFSSTQGIIMGNQGMILRIGQKPAVVVTGIEDQLTSKGIADMTYSLVPNPATRAISVYKEGFSIQPQTLTVCRMDGTVCLTTDTNDGTLDVSALPKGMYCIRLSKENKVLRFIKE